ncbi:MAG: endonuclease VIII [Lachnospiraceae bacterium]
MIELPEAMVLAEQISKTCTGKTVKNVHGPSYLHKFTWFHGDAETYDGLLKGKQVTGAQAFGIYVEISLGQNDKLNFNDGIHARFLDADSAVPDRYQLLITFTDGCALVFTVAMYGGFACHQGGFDNKYYLHSRERVSPFAQDFTQLYFDELLSSVKPTMSAKAFLATEQRIPGIGNGVLQDILLTCRIHPKRKVQTLSEDECMTMYQSVKEVLSKMTEAGGRDTEKDLFGNSGGYQTLLSAKTYKSGCPVCGGTIEKQAYMGGTIYTCVNCQPI